jgi:hypothetical protein
MVSPLDVRTGIEIVRKFSLGAASSRVLVELAFRNIAQRTVRWSIWDVVQLAADMELAGGGRCHDPSCCVTTPVNPHSRFEKGFNVMFGAADNPQWQVQDSLLRAEYRWQIGKVGLDSTAGWIAFHKGSQGRAFVARFPYVPDGEYPDGGEQAVPEKLGSLADKLRSALERHLEEPELLYNYCVCLRARD